MAKRKYIKGLENRFREYSELQENGCRLWTGHIGKTGYGTIGIHINGKLKIKDVHRVAYEFYKGPVPDGLHLDHKCHDPKTCKLGIKCPHRRCINPDHMEPVPQPVNNSAERSTGLGTIAAVAQYKAMTQCKRGHEFTPENTYFVNGTGKTGPTQIRVCRKCRSARVNEWHKAKRLALKLAALQPPEPERLN